MRGKWVVLMVIGLELGGCSRPDAGMLSGVAPPMRNATQLVGTYVDEAEGEIESWRSRPSLWRELKGRRPVRLIGWDGGKGADAEWDEGEKWDDAARTRIESVGSGSLVVVRLRGGREVGRCTVGYQWREGYVVIGPRSSTLYAFPGLFGVLSETVVVGVGPGGDLVINGGQANLLSWVVIPIAWSSGQEAGVRRFRRCDEGAMTAAGASHDRVRFSGR